MNRHLHRIIFNAARGMRMVVQETASSTGKGKSKPTGGPGGAGAAVKAVALLGALVALPGEAQIVGAPNVPANLRPTVLVAPNGVPLINIQTPSAAGVSRNVYQQFNVAPNGAILNNSRTNVQSQLGGFVQGNPYLATGPARIILNEVNGGWRKLECRRRRDSCQQCNGQQFSKARPSGRDEEGVRGVQGQGGVQ